MTQRTRLLTLSYRRIYPRWLFPGKSLMEPDADPSDGERPDTLFVVDTLDPRSWLAAIRLTVEHRSQQLVIAWWTVALALPIWWISRGCRRNGIPVTFLCHNVVDHESLWWKRVLTGFVLRQGSRFVVASEAEARRLRTVVPNALIDVHPHPVYRHFPAPAVSLPRRAARELLFFGLIRPYKGLDVLINALAEAKAEDWHLTVAGEPWYDLHTIKRRAEAAGISGQIEWIERYIPSETAATLFERADAIVLPYRQATGCGVLALALGEGRPVVASDLPGLREQVEHGRTGWLVPAGDEHALRLALRNVTSGTAVMEKAIRELATRWSWDSLAATLIR